MLKALFPKRLCVITGAFGSGKSEVAVNMALQLCHEGELVALADLDMVNPFFRSADAKKPLESAGVKVVTSPFANTNSEAVSVPSEVYGLIETGTYKAILDLGGEDLGARTIARFRPDLNTADVDLLCVVNPFRPLTETPERIAFVVHELQKASRLPVTGLICNPNLMDATTEADFAHGVEIVDRASAVLDIPVRMAVAVPGLLTHPCHWPVMPLRRTILKPWEKHLAQNEEAE